MEKKTVMKSFLVGVLALLTPTVGMASTEGCENYKMRTYEVPLTINKDTPMAELDLSGEVPPATIILSFGRGWKDIDHIQLLNEKQYQIGESRSVAPVMKINVRWDKLIEKSKRLNLLVGLKSGTDIRKCLLLKRILVGGNGRQLQTFNVNKKYRYAIDVHSKGDYGINTGRIPGLVKNNDGVLLAVYDARRVQERDLQGDIDIILRRSCDGGQTWSAPEDVLDMGTYGNLPEKFNGVSDGNILVDKSNGHVFLAGLWMHGVVDEKTGHPIEGLTSKSNAWNHQWRCNGSLSGFDIGRTSQFLMRESKDGGKTWGEMRNLTRLKDSTWMLFAPAPGNGIMMNNGTLVMPAQGRDSLGTTFSTIIWSKDHGATWHRGEPANMNTTECMAVEIPNNGIMLNMRDNRNWDRKDSVNGRSVYVTYDLGKTWKVHPTSRKALQEPVCMASFYRHFYHENGKRKSLLLFMNPNSRTSRDHLSIKVSFDNGNTWPEEYTMLIDELEGFGYSCITSIDENRIGVLFEGSNSNLKFLSIPLKEILKQ